MTYSKYYHTWATKPSGGAWTWGDIDALRIGLQCNSPLVVDANVNLVIRPTSDVAVNLTRNTGSDNYALVDDVTSDGDSTYVYALGANQVKTDEYGMSNLSYTGSSLTVNHFTLYGRLKESIEAFYGLRVIISSTVYDDGSSDGFALTGSWATYSHQWDTNPATSSAWTEADINGLNAGIRIRTGTLNAAKKGWLTQLYGVANVDINVSPEIRTTQCYAVVNYVPTASVVTLNDPKNVDMSHSRKLIRHNLPSGNYIVYDAGRGAKTLTINGTETSGAYSDMDDIKTICHYGAKVTIAGLDDTNFNTDYWVSDIQFSAGPGYPANMYDYTLTLEEL